VRLDPWVVRLVICAVVAMWLATQIADLVNPAYDPPESINALFLSLVGAVLALRKQNGHDDSEDRKQ
jgi:hypothetical protein